MYTTIKFYLINKKHHMKEDEDPQSYEIPYDFNLEVTKEVIANFFKENQVNLDEYEDYTLLEFVEGNQFIEWAMKKYYDEAYKEMEMYGAN